MTDTTFPDPPAADFIFGTLATDEQRLAQIRAVRSGIVHAQRFTPLDPRPDEPVTIRVSTGPHIAATQVTCYYTIGGSDPRGTRGVAHSGVAVSLSLVDIVLQSPAP